MSMQSPLTSFCRSFFTNTITFKSRPARLFVLLGLIGVAATGLAATASSSASLRQIIFGGASSLVRTRGAQPKAAMTDRLLADVPAPDGSNMSVERRGNTATLLTGGPNLSVARAGHNATLFADGRILIAGGDGSGSAEILDLSAGSSATVGANMNDARSMHSAALLQDGRVLIVGGRDAGGNELSSGEIFDPASSSFTGVGGMEVARVHPLLRVLFDGKVQIIGGNDHRSLEIYDPAAGIFGGYAQVPPDGDLHVTLIDEVMAAATRSALLTGGQTVTELGSSALAAGGVDANGNATNAATIFASSGASVSSDKLDYPPGTIAVITGRGFQPNENVVLTFHEYPHVDTAELHTFTVQADADGNFIFNGYAPEEADLGITYILGAKGESSGKTAQTTFHDANITTTTTLNAISSSLTAGQTGVAYSGQVSASPAVPDGQTVELQVRSGGCGSGGFSNVGTTTTTSGNGSFSATFTAPATAGTYGFQANFPQTGNISSNNWKQSNSTPCQTITVTAANAAPVASAVSISGTAEYAQLLTGNYTYSDADGDLQGTSTFRWLRNGTTVVSTSQTYSTVGADVGQTLTFEVTPVAATGTSPGSAVQSSLLTIAKKDVTITPNSGQNKTYGASDPTLTYTHSALGGSDTDSVFTGALSRAAGENVGTYAINLGTLSAGGNYNLLLSATPVTFEIKKRDATWTTNPNSKTYGDADPAPLTTGSGDFLAADGVTASYSRVAGENASPPTYHITATLSATGDLNNYNITNTGADFSITSWWTITGFYQPVDMPIPVTVLNIVKGGSTVPLKFNIYAGTPGPTTERKSVSDVMFGSVQVVAYECNLTPALESLTDVSNTGATSLRYDTTGAQFIQNWQTPKPAGRCYQVRMTALDGSHIDAFFKTK